jgi:protein SCO1/2
MGRWWRAWPLPVLLLAAGAGGLWLWLHAAGPAQLPDEQALAIAQVEELKALPDFSLQHAGGPLTGVQLHGRWAYVFFGYTSCPDACPATLALLGRAQQLLKARAAAAPRIVFISFDPQRDTPELLQRYVAGFGDDIVAATGSDAALRGLTEFFGVSYERRNDQRGDAHAAQGAGRAYTFDHTDNIFLVTPDGRWLATFPPAGDVEAIVEDSVTLMQGPPAP